MVRHYHLSPVRHKDLRLRNSLIHDTLNLTEQNRNVQRHAVSDDAGGMIIKHTGRQRVQRKFSIIIYDCVARIGSALKTDDDVRLLSKHVCNLAFSLVSPVCSHNCFYHNLLSLHWLSAQGVYPRPAPV